MRAIRLFITSLFLIFSCTSIFSQQKMAVIFDTDMGPDYDDVGAMALLHALADSGHANILATIASTKYERVVAVLDVLNTYFGRPGTPIGVPTGKAIATGDVQHWSDTLVARYPHKLNSNDQAIDAVGLYRQLLSKQADHSVVIISVGFFTNLADLLKSGADKYSQLNGRELVRQKVKQLVSMAGTFPRGREFNIHMDAAAAKLVADQWPTDILFSGFEIGEKIKSGLPLIRNNSITGSPVKDVFRISIPLAKNDSAGRMSWDQTAVLTGIKGPEPWYRLERGKIVIDTNGANTWSAGTGNHYYLVAVADPAIVSTIINKLMQHQPSRK